MLRKVIFARQVMSISYTKCLPYNTVKIEGGMFHTFRLLGMFNMLGKKQKQNNNPGIPLPNTGIRTAILTIHNILTGLIFLPNITAGFQKYLA